MSALKSKLCQVKIDRAKHCFKSEWTLETNKYKYAYDISYLCFDQQVDDLIKEREDQKIQETAKEASELAFFTALVRC